MKSPFFCLINLLLYPIAVSIDLQYNSIIISEEFTSSLCNIFYNKDSLFAKKLRKSTVTKKGWKVPRVPLEVILL